MKCRRTLATTFALLVGCSSLVAAQEEASVDDSQESYAIFDLASFNLGGDGCDTCQKGGSKGAKGCGCNCYLFGPNQPITLLPENRHNLWIGGWTQGGFHNKSTPLSTDPFDDRAFNNNPDAVNLHQQWLYFEKKLSRSPCQWDWGFRADFAYGNDARKMQAFGGTHWDTDYDHGIHGWAIPQLYGEVGRGGLSVKFGHFFTIVGYESIAAPKNFFYSHSLTMFNSEPFTHTGILATYTENECLTWYAGWTLGWDTGFEDFNNGSNYLGGLSYAFGDRLAITYTSTAGNLGRRGSEAYSHSVIFDFLVCPQLNYVMQADFLRINQAAQANPPHLSEDDIGLNQYIFYAYNECLQFGSRFEWWRDEGLSHYETTGGVNYWPHANLVIRPEARYDWVPATGFGQTTVGIDAILVY
jgi:hypothetical protein